MFKNILAIFVLLALSAAINAQTCGFTFLNAGATCGSNINNTATTCNQELACYTNTQTSASTCTLPSSFGASCNETAGRFCVSSAYAPLQCIANTCIYLKAVSQSCRSNADCYSNNCTVNPSSPTNGTNGTSPSPTPSGLTGVCQALGEFRVCTNNRDCDLGLYCNKTSTLAPTGICTKFALANEGCSAIAPCAPGLGCVIPFGVFGVCRAKTANNGSCTTDSECVSGVCGPSGSCITAYSIPSNATCTRGVQCQAGLACNTTTGRCATATSVSCDTATAATRCKFTNDNMTAGCNCGFCFETVNPCANEKTLFASCMSTNCPNPVAPYTKAGGYYPYDNTSCARNCVSQFNNLQCCYTRTNSAYVKLADSTAVCTTVTPTPTTTASISPSNPPSTSPSPSGTVGVASISRISIATVLLAVVVAVLL